MLSTVLAQTIDLSPGGQFSGLNSITIANIISALIILMMIIAALIFFFMLVWGGIRYITAGGDKAQTEVARSQITAALIGLVIVFAAWAIVNLVSLFFGIDLLNLNIPNAQSGS
ncbi:pilin [Patescibacteria group bacterium]|nr:pilin [Patescibacteria group bacterium]